jgi:hypothetical protein
MDTSESFFRGLRWSSQMGSASGAGQQQQQQQPTYDNIKVVVRSRPLNAEEKKASTPILVTCDLQMVTDRRGREYVGPRQRRST